jgi:hypothetical protein
MSDNINIGVEILDSVSPKLDIIDDTQPISIKIDKPDENTKTKEVNFGMGIEMLMNDKKRSNSSSKKQDDEINLDSLESQLNELTEDLNEPSIKKDDMLKSAFSSSFNLNKDSDNNNTNADKISISGISNIEEINTKTPIIESIPKKDETNETWDGYKKFNNIPINPDIEIKKEVKLTREEILKKKFELLRKFDMLKKKGARLTKEYTMESSLDEMQGEYEMLISEKEKSNSIKFQGKMMMALVTGLEYLNNRFDPFDFKLDGWAESVTENIDDYDDIFGELHEKYSSKAKMAPELKLLFQLGGSAVMLHMTNTMFKSAMPGMDDIMRQNPELMQQFTQAAVGSMGQNNPGFGNFMSGIMGGGNGGGNENHSQHQYQQQQHQYQQQQHQPQQYQVPPGGSPPGPRQPNYDDNAEDIETAYGSYGDQMSNLRGRGINNNMEQRSSSSRPEMKGPSDISDILSGLKQKSKTIQIKPKSSSNIPEFKTSGSTISIDELKSISKDADNVPRKSKRKPRSERNTVSLDI